MILFHRFVWIAVCLFLYPLSQARAEHTPEHRFTISGYVYDNAGKPVPGAVGVRNADNLVLGTTETDRSGYYTIQLHLHDANAGNKLTVESEAGKQELIVKFDPHDKVTERTAVVNFGAVPPPSGLKSNGMLIFGVAAVIAVGAYFLVIKKRKRRKEPPAKKKHKKGSQPAST